MRTRDIHHISTGGTIVDSTGTNGILDVDPDMQEGILEILCRIPSTNYNHIDVGVSGDSSSHPREYLIKLGQAALSHADQGHGIIIEHGTDTMNLAAATLALMGNEKWKYPVTFLGSMKSLEEEDSDAPVNAITAGFFTAYGDASGVFAVRPSFSIDNAKFGTIITSRHDTPGGSIDWHGRGISHIPEEKQQKGYFAKIRLDKLVDESCNIIFDLGKRGKRGSIVNELLQLIKIQRLFYDETLDYHDQVVVGGRGRYPNVSMLGVGLEDMRKLKSRPQGEAPERIIGDIINLVNRKRSEGHAYGSTIQYLAVVDHMARHRQKAKTDSDSYFIRESWKDAMKVLLSKDLGLNRYGHITSAIASFWEKYSNVDNDNMDFRDIASFRVSTDPDFLYRAFQETPPKGLVLQATGASGIRLREGFENYRPLLTYCRESEIPVVITSSARGEVTSFEYEPGLELLENDLSFFAGTMDTDLIEPRMALLNSATNKEFLEQLVNQLDVPESQRKEIRRNMQRQLLSGSHYRIAEEGEMPDRKRVEDLYGIETRIDLLSGMHAKKAILASYLNEVAQRKLVVPESVAGVLNKY